MLTCLHGIMFNIKLISCGLWMVDTRYLTTLIAVMNLDQSASNDFNAMMY